MSFHLEAQRGWAPDEGLKPPAPSSGYAPGYVVLSYSIHVRFLKILASTYGPGLYDPGPYGPGPLIILKNSREVCISNMVLEHIWLRKLFQIINGPGTYMVLEH